MEKQYLITLTQVNTILAYLQHRPFKEVVSIIGILNEISKNEHKPVEEKAKK
tara:strand:- start:1815 stop:1970 length:156 start_codon:yes stop_codon:yes gene_type:complete